LIENYLKNLHCETRSVEAIWQQTDVHKRQYCFAAYAMTAGMFFTELLRYFTGKGDSLTREYVQRLDAWRMQARPRYDVPLTQCRCVVVDVETAGLDPRRDALIAIGAVALHDGHIQLAEHLEVVLRQVAVSTHDNILVHGIGGTAQRGGQAPPEALLGFLEFVGKDPLIAFHVMFDETALRRAVRQHLGFTLRARWLDLAYLMPALFPEHARSARTLDDWLRLFGIEVSQRHNASADALATAQLLLIALERAHRHGHSDYRTRHKLEKAQRYTRYQSAATG